METIEDYYGNQVPYTSYTILAREVEDTDEWEYVIRIELMNQPVSFTKPWREKKHD